MSMSPRMTINEVLAEMRKHGMPMSASALSDCIREGVFPFGKAISTGSRTNFLIMRADFDKWAKEYLEV